MLTTEILKATETDPYTTIYYRDSNDIAIVIVVLDQQGRLISKEISEYDCHGKIVCSVRYASDHHTVLGFRAYDYDNNNKEIGRRDYHVIDGETKFLVRARTVWIKKDKLAHCYFYLEDNKPFVYDVFEYSESCGMVIEGRFDMHGNDVTLRPDFRTPSYDVGNNER